MKNISEIKNGYCIVHYHDWQRKFRKSPVIKVCDSKEEAIQEINKMYSSGSRDLNCVYDVKKEALIR